MSCNGCRVLRKGCSENCILRPCLQWIESPEAQGYATVFVAKFFGRAGLMSFISAVPESQRPALFHSLLFEACGRTVNPVNGAVGLLWTGNWHVCQAAVETVLRGATLRPMPELLNGESTFPVSDEASEADVASANTLMRVQGSNNQFHHSRFSCSRSSRSSLKRKQIDGLDLKLTPTKGESCKRAGSPSMNSEESVVTNTTCLDGDNQCVNKEKKLLNLFI